MKLATSEILATITSQHKPHNRIEITATLESDGDTAQWILRADDEDAGTGAWDTLAEATQSACDAWGLGSFYIELTEAGKTALNSAYSTNEQ